LHTLSYVDELGMIVFWSGDGHDKS